MSRPVVPLNAWSRTKIPDPTISIRSLRIDGQRVFVRTYRVTRDSSGRALGEGGVPVIVLVHGIGVSARYFIPLANALADFADVLMLDLPGFSTLPVPKKALGIDGFADVLAAVIEAEGVRDPVILGHSMGAQVVIAALARHHDLAGRILLLGPPVNSAERSLVRVGARFIQSSLLEPLRVGLVAIPAYLMCGPHWFAEVLPAMLGFPVEDVIARTSCLVVLVRGEHDYVAPRDWLASLAEAAGGAAEIHTVDHAAHSVMYRHHDIIAHRLIQLAATASPLGGDRVREADVWAAAERLDVDTSGIETAYDLLEHVLPTSEHQRDESVIAIGSRRMRERRRGSLVEAWHVVAAQAMDAARASIGSGQWRSVTPGDYAHSVRQEGRNMAEAAREAWTLLRHGSTDAPGAGEGEPLTPYPVYLLSGMTQTWRIWSRLAERLRASGCDVRPIKGLGRSLATIDELARRVGDQLAHDDATDAVLVAHSKGGLVAKAVLLGDQGARVRRVIAAGTPWSGSALAGLAPWWAPARMLSPDARELRELAEHREVNGRIWTVSASFDQQVPNGTTLDGSRDWRLATPGHNHLTDSPEALAAIEALLAEDAAT
ncbi:alpha/beta fold hydrolase [Nanchangia anserum]|uniref:Alpha/beta fold hydrolase n=1 Tax=Nanchangia anserum TaxID=2692125 RepID=A0A8I0GEC9_9ACTO|nr:alpha/beta fold hydrolase [Nanchangia anserum]MBD3689307.1 alpha/beta fold hydrolase [Nanchangia anserum]QOX81522.1 alpha/beta fold hydrolase [Nanchangia anserum]